MDQKSPQIVLDSGKIKLGEIAEAFKILEDTIKTILHKYLGMWKLCSKWVLCFLTEHYFELFKRTK